MRVETKEIIYRITVEGILHKRWADWFSGMQITYADEHNPIPITIIQGPIADQSALRGMLIKLWDLNLTLIAVNRIDRYLKKENNHETLDTTTE